jgi:hypothetical protein
MSGIISGIDYGLLFSGSSTDISTSMLNALYNPSATISSSTAVSTGNPLTDLKLAQKNETDDVAKEMKQPQVARDIRAFKDGVTRAKTIDQALSNPNVLKVLLTANNLEADIQYPGMAKKILTSDPSKPNSVVNQMNSTAWTNAVKTFNFAKNGLKALNDPKVISTLTNAYAEVKWRESLDKATPGLSKALAFLSQAKSITSVDQILGDPVNRDVITTALGIPQQIAFQELRAQETAITTRLDISKLKDPKFVTNLTDQYLLAKQQSSQTSSSGTDIYSLLGQAGGLMV